MKHVALAATLRWSAGAGRWACRTVVSSSHAATATAKRAGDFASGEGRRDEARGSKKRRGIDWESGIGFDRCEERKTGMNDWTRMMSREGGEIEYVRGHAAMRISRADKDRCAHVLNTIRPGILRDELG